jgi:hypothetical protein
MARRRLFVLLAFAFVAAVFSQLGAQPSSIRNSFGLRFDPVTGSMWETENEPATDDTDSLRLVGTPTGSPVPTGSPTTPGFDGGARTGVGLVIAAVLIGGLILLRRRILRR